MGLDSQNARGEGILRERSRRGRKAQREKRLCSELTGGGAGTRAEGVRLSVLYSFYHSFTHLGIYSLNKHWLNGQSVPGMTKTAVTQPTGRLGWGHRGDSHPP